MKLLAIDGNSIMNRAFYGIRMLSNSKGFFTNAITGFMNIYLKELEIVRPDCVAVAFDLKAPTFRHKKVSSYKANRKGMPDELAMQMPIIKKILSALGVIILETEGFEADDILGTVSKTCADNGNECYILTGDRDSFQLVSEKVTVRLATTKETVIYTPEKIQEVYGLEPLQMIEIKALMGDSSDNISGVAGIGEKTALALITEFGSVDNLYKNLDTAKLSPSVKSKLENGYDSAIESRWLATIALDTPIDVDISSCQKGQKRDDEVREILTDLEMFKLMERLELGEATTTSDIPPEKKAPQKEYKASALDEQKLTNIINNKCKATYLCSNNKLEIFACDEIFFTEDKNLILKFLSSKIQKQTFDAKPAYKFAFENGSELVENVFSCDLAGYLLNSQSSEYTVENLCSIYKVDFRSDLAEFADITSLSALCERLSAEIELNEMTKLLTEIEQPLCEVIASMETIGVKVDIDGVKAFGLTLTADIKQLEEDIFRLAGREFNISSPKQLGVVLFEELDLPAKKKTKSGYSTNAEVLEFLQDKHPIVPLILEYRTLTKLNSTYVEGLLKQVADDGRVRSVFKQTETRTGRISSTEPNMQNIPVRKEIGRNMRKFFIADSDRILLDADYSQIELRVLAHVSDDENMKNAFLSGKDIHTSTAAQVFGVPEDFVSADMRRAAKAVNFGIVYGIGAFSLSKDLGVSVAEADRYIKQYLSNYSGVDRFMKDVVDYGIRDGYVTTIFGRRRYIPEFSSSNKMLQAFGKRAAMNAPIQGAAADIIKIAMVRVYQRLKAEKLDAKLILQVHDELLIESSLEDKDRAATILNEEMVNAASLSVPLIADVNEGESWYAAKD